jgi:tryptophanyl-tRNA synthetase
MSPRILSGIQPTGNPHLGNYFGAIKQHIELQEEGNAFYFIANYHALTSVRDAEKLKQATRDVAATYIALGLDPKKAVLFKQSDIPEVHELTWFLECVTGMGILQRAHSYKDKVANGLTPNIGLFCYPALMAADILIYGSDIVPVGEDQLQHVEICKDMAKSFNAAFNTDIFNIPEARLSETSKVPGVDGRKMSKSYNNTIPIFASDKELKRAVSRIVTDSKNPKKVALNPLTCNALKILQLFEDADDLIVQYLKAPERGFLGYGVTKKRIIDALENRFGDARKEFNRLRKEGNGELDDILAEGAQTARSEARIMVDKCRAIVGI